MKNFYAIPLLALLLCLPGFATYVTGTFVSVPGTLLVGRVVFILRTPGNRPVQRRSVAQMVLPGTQAVAYLQNGQIPGCAGQFLIGNDDIVQSGTYYEIDVYDATNKLMGKLYTKVTGTTMDLGHAGSGGISWPVRPLFQWPTQIKIYP